MTLVDNDDDESPLSVTNIANQIIDSTLDLAFDYIYSNNIAITDFIELKGEEKSVDSNNKFVNLEETEIEVITMSTDSSSSDVNNPNSNLKSAIPTPRKRQPAKDGRKRSVQFAPEFIKDDDDTTTTGNIPVTQPEENVQAVNKSNHVESDIKEETIDDIKEVEITRL